MSEADGAARTSRRTTKGVPPQRFPEENRSVIGIKKKRSQKSRSVRSCKSTNSVAHQEIEQSTEEKLASLATVVADKEADLQKASALVNNLTKKIDLLNTSTETPAGIITTAHIELLDAQNLVDNQTIELRALKTKTETEKTLILKRKALDIEKLIQTDEESCSEDEVEDRATYLSDWVMDQNKNYPVTNSSSPTHPEPQSNNVNVQELVKALKCLVEIPSKNNVIVKSTVDKDLPKFGGEPELWIQFKSEFDRTTMKFQFDESENLIRLRKALTGTAKDTVQHLMANVRNVNVIMESLEKRFGRPRLVINALAAKAKMCNTVSISRPETIIEFGIAVQALVSNIVSFNESGYLNSVELLDAFVQKLSCDLQSKWFEWLIADSKRKENLQNFTNWITLQLDIAYRRSDCRVFDASENKSHRDCKRGPGRIHVLMTEEHKCPCCQKGYHLLEKCFLFHKWSLQDRWSLVKDAKLCISCLLTGHRSKECKVAKKCTVKECNRHHHKLLHTDVKGEQKESAKSVSTATPPISAQTVSGNVDLHGNIAIIHGCDGPLAIIPVKVRGTNNIESRCHIMLDCGASRTLMKQELAEKIGLDGPTVPYSYKGVTGDLMTEKKSKRVECDISGIQRSHKFHKLRGVVTVSEIRMNPYSIDIEQAKRKWPHLKGVVGHNLLNVVPDIIIGNNNPHLILARKLLMSTDKEPIGWRTLLGWTISGNFDEVEHGVVNVVYGVSNNELYNLIKSSFSFENFGVKLSKGMGKNLDEKRAYEILENTTKKIGDTWETGLLWNEDHVIFPESESSALKRLEYIENKMKNPDYRKLYLGKFEEYQLKGYMKKLSPEEAAKRKDSTYVIPHFGVANPNKPGKFRFVLDAKAKSHGVSLNDKLLKGPDLIRSLVGVLWNFRLHRIALNGDIADMFHRIRIREEDRDSQRLLWRDGDPTKSVDHYQMEVMIFGATSSPSSAIYVKNRNALMYREQFPETMEVIQRDFYVDDCLSGGATVEQVVQLRRQISQICQAGNFTVCKWMSNSQEVLASIPEELQADGAKQFTDKENLPGERVLGMWWNPKEDVFSFKLGLHKVKKEVLEGAIPTKREMCSLVMSLFDPIGFIAHYKIKGNILLQEVWSHGIGWDDEIPINIYLKWKTWLEFLQNIREVKVPRCYFYGEIRNAEIQLHVFVDASSEAFSTVAYLRIQSQGIVTVSFVAAKARVAPLKKTTIPRLELQAALLGARLSVTLEEELKLNIKTRYFWSDSSTVLQWLRSRAGKLKEFVANRIGEIQECTNIHEWHWVPTKFNIADVATRFESEVRFTPSDLWYQGPSFLRENPVKWNFEEQRKKSGDGIVAVLIAEEEKHIEYKNLLSATKQVTPNPMKFSVYWRLVRATAAVKVAFNYWRNKTQRVLIEESPWQKKRFGVTAIEGEKYISRIQPVDLNWAENQLFKLAQEDEFENDFNSMRLHGKLLKNGKLWKLSPVLDTNGLFRIDGRIGAAKVRAAVKFPVILPSRHYITDLIVDFEHQRCAHQGLETVLSNLRQRFWLIDARHTVKRSWKRCQECLLRNSKPVIPKMGNLPPSRLADRQPPFTFSGIDIFGPIEITVGRHHEKRWGVLLCCMVTRAVYLDIVHSLSTDDILLVLSRFIDTCGRPNTIYSDNGTNFVGAAKELRKQWKEIDFSKIQEYGKFQEIQWVFNPPASPHMGGVWERLIQTVKKCLHVTLHKKFPRDSTLITVLKSVENIVNSRPLTHVSIDPYDPEPLTPNHFLRGGCDVGPSIPATLDPSDDHLRSQWKRSQVMSDQFWIRWTKDYLPKLLQRGKWKKSVNPIEVGTLVFLVDEQTPRNCWLRGYVSEVLPAKDGQIRRVYVTVVDKQSKVKKTLMRSVHKLCPLGLKMEIEEQNVPQFGAQNVAD